MPFLLIIGWIAAVVSVWYGIEALQLHEWSWAALFFVLAVGMAAVLLNNPPLP